MAVGRFFRGLTAYDLLGNLIPGVIVLTALVSSLSGKWIPSTIGEYALFALFAYLLGGVIQLHASNSVGDRENFNQIMRTSGQLDNLEIIKEKEENEGTTGISGCEIILQSVFSPIPIIFNNKTKNVVEENTTYSQIRQHVYNKYNIEPNNSQLSTLYRLVLSEIERKNNRAIAVRMQALRNLYRGVWIAGWYILVLVVTSIPFTTPYTQCFSLLFCELSYFSLLILLVIVLIFVILFRYINEKRNKKFVEYLFTDYMATVSISDDTTTGSSREDDPN